MKIEKVKARTMFMFDGQEFGSLSDAQLHRLAMWLTDTRVDAELAEYVAARIAQDAEGFRVAAAPFLIKRRGPRKPKEVGLQLNLEPGEDGEPQVSEAA